MITCDLKGGLGNQLFQIAATIAYSLETNQKFVFSYSEVLEIGMVRPTYWNSFLKALHNYTTINIDPNLFSRYREPTFHYTEIPQKMDGNLILDGYFQSFKYFEKHKSKVLEIMGVNQMRDLVRYEYPYLTQGDNFWEKFKISMHFRMGDYKVKQDCHPVLPYEYYERALETVPRDCISVAQILYFCEEEDLEYVQTNIVEPLKAKWQNEHNIELNMIHADISIPDWKQMLIMSYSNVNIISNSTFSWWGAYLNTRENKTVIYPAKWFGPKLENMNTADLFPEDWIRV